MLTHKSGAPSLVVAVAATTLAILNAYAYAETKEPRSFWAIIFLLGSLVFSAWAERRLW